MVFYTLFISVFNLALGYFLALYLQSRGISAGWLRPDLFSRFGLPRFGASGPVVAPPRAPAEPVAPDAQPGSPLVLSIKSIAKQTASWPGAQPDPQAIDAGERSEADRAEVVSAK